jgi:hypothetical protein
MAAQGGAGKDAPEPAGFASTLMIQLHFKRKRRK